MAGNHGRRLEKVEQGLTPLQAVLLWLDEAHQSPSLMTYVRSLLGKPPSAFPLVFLPRQVEQSVREAMKGRKREEVEHRVFQAKRDVAYLFYLHQTMNVRVAEKEEVLAYRAQRLHENLMELLRQEMVSDQMASIRRRVYDEPYPLEPETAAAVEAAQQHAVETWDSLAEVGVIEDWTADALVEQGAWRLPLGAYSYRSEDPDADESDDAWTPLTRPSRAELRELLGSDAEVEEFLTQREYSYGVAGIRDAEFEALAAKVERAVQDLVASGKVREGSVVTLETVPHLFLREAPLVEGAWLDRTVVELAEWGALLREKGFRVVISFDDHPLAWDRILPAERRHGDLTQVEREQVTALREEARRRVARAPGERRTIEGQEYVSFPAYSSWRGRKAKGNLRAQVRRGIDLASWNTWVAGQEKWGHARLAGVPVTALQCWAERAAVEHCRDEVQAAERLAQREQMLADLDRWILMAFDDGDGGDVADGFWGRVLPLDHLPFREKVLAWRVETLALYGDLYERQASAQAVGERYFGGREMLFPDLAEGLRTLVELVELCATEYNRVCAARLEWRRRTLRGRDHEGRGGAHAPARAGSERIDLERVRQASGPRVAAAAAYVVDQAKAETLRLCDENEAAASIMEKHLA
ncbi:MAG: hypothetical protein HY689_13865 [Chloroflexi bacterium]|nr:hypothetical protein [Chloroflexota bacterium]